MDPFIIWIVARGAQELAAAEEAWRREVSELQAERALLAAGIDAAADRQAAAAAAALPRHWRPPPLAVLGAAAAAAAAPVVEFVPLDICRNGGYGCGGAAPRKASSSGLLPSDEEKNVLTLKKPALTAVKVHVCVPPAAWTETSGP